MNSWVTTGRLIWIGVFGLFGVTVIAAGVKEVVDSAAAGGVRKAEARAREADARAEEARYKAEEARWRSEEAATKAACDDCANFVTRDEVREVA